MGRRKKCREKHEQERTSIGAILFGVVWVGAWTIGMAWFDWVWATSVVNQIRTLSFPSVSGQVISSEIVEEPGDETVLYRPDVKYGYVVGNGEFVSHQISQWAESSSFKKESQKVVEQYPVGRQVTVYYSPRDPSHAVLEPGFHPNNFLVALLLVPFNLIAIRSLAFACGSWLPRTTDKPVEVSIRQTGLGTRLQIHSLNPIVAAGMTLFLLCFLTAIPAFFGGQFAPREYLVAGAWGIVILGTGYAWVRARNSGTRIDVDDMAQTLTLSRGAAKAGEAVPPPEMLGLRDILAVKSARKRPSPDDTTEDDESSRFQPTLVIRDTEKGQRELSIADTSEANARWIAGWLRKRLGIAG